MTIESCRREEFPKFAESVNIILKEPGRDYKAKLAKVISSFNRHSSAIRTYFRDSSPSGPQTALSEIKKAIQASG